MSEITKALMKFYFLTFLFLIVMVKVMVIEDAYLLVVFGGTWIPQIIWNFTRRSRKAPTLLFCVSSSLMHIYFPCYARLVDGNFLSFKPKYDTIRVLLIIQAISLAIIFL